jgi:hypothetical protein
MNKILFLVISIVFSSSISLFQIENNKDIVEFSKSENIFEVQKRGCCSWHGGVAGCSGGRVVCSDGSLSPSCTCNSTIDPLVGCKI